jgi:hypothetical protein
VSELSDTQSVDRSQTTSFLFQFTEDTPNRDRFKKHLVPAVFSRFRIGRRESGQMRNDDVQLCLIAQPGRQAGQPNHRQRVRSPLTAPAVKERFWLRRQPPRTCRVNCGCIIVLKSTRPAHTWGEAGATQSLRKAFFCSVQPSCVMTERETTR